MLKHRGTVRLIEGEVMMSKGQELHDALLEEAVRAQEEYLNVISAAKERRRRVFQKALLGPVTATEIGRQIGMSSGYVGKIAKGQR